MILKCKHCLAVPQKVKHRIATGPSNSTPGFKPKITESSHLKDTCGPKFRAVSLAIARRQKQDFPSGPGVKHLPANAGDTGSTPGQGRSHMPWSNEVHMPQVLKPACLEPMLHKRSHCNEKPTHGNWRVAPAHQN